MAVNSTIMMKSQAADGRQAAGCTRRLDGMEHKDWSINRWPGEQVFPQKLRGTASRLTRFDYDAPAATI
jgi:hypothetical protein